MTESSKKERWVDVVKVVLKTLQNKKVINRKDLWEEVKKELENKWQVKLEKEITQFKYILSVLKELGWYYRQDREAYYIFPIESRNIINMLREHSFKLLGIGEEFYYTEYDELTGKIPKVSLPYFLQHLESGYPDIYDLYMKTQELEREVDKIKEHLREKLLPHLKNMLANLFKSKNLQVDKIHDDNLFEVTFETFLLDDAINRYVHIEIDKINDKRNIRLGAVLVFEGVKSKIEDEELKDTIIAILREIRNFRDSLYNREKLNNDLIQLADKYMDYREKVKSFRKKLNELTKKIEEIKYEVQLGGILKGKCKICAYW